MGRNGDKKTKRIRTQIYTDKHRFKNFLFIRKPGIQEYYFMVSWLPYY
jgi:hypothetical protein